MFYKTQGEYIREPLDHQKAEDAMIVREGYRRIVQISAVPETDGNWPTVFALCNDGTVWEAVEDDSMKWRPWAALPSIPQGPVGDHQY